MHEQARRALDTHRALVRYTGPVLDVDHEDAKYAPCEIQTVDGASGTIFAFAGMAHSFAMPVREFFGILSGANMNVVFIKDFQQAWYQLGLLGATSTRNETVAFLETTFGHLPRPWIFVGASAGGHAAVYFGEALGADRIAAFGAQTYLDREVYDRHHPAAIPDFGIDFDDPENDLATVTTGNAKGVHLYFGDGNALDRMHAERLAGRAGVELHAEPCDDHTVALAMRAAGTLEDAIFGDLRRASA